MSNDNNKAVKEKPSREELEALKAAKEKQVKQTQTVRK